MTTHDGVQELLDRARIRDLLVRYFHGADRADKIAVRSCFTDDVVAKFEGRPKVKGADALIDQMAIFRKLGAGELTITTHFMGSLHFLHLDRASAETETYAFAFLVAPHDAAHVVRMRSLRYVDGLVRMRNDWKIASRLVTLDWSCVVPCDFARAFADRQVAIPAE